MPRETPILPGRQRAVALVREFVTRPERDGHLTTRRTPTLIITGPKGCGKTALLKAVESRVRGKIPYAFVDCGAMKSVATWEVLASLAFDLNRNAADYRSIPFPRFVTAQVAIAAQVGPPGQAARALMKEAQENARHVDQLRTFLDNLAQDVANAVPVVSTVPGVGTAVRRAAKLIFDGLVSWRRGRRVVLGGGLDWYGSGDKAYDELVRLNQLTQADASDDDQQEATERLWAAFLADLRAAFAASRATRTWSLNCVLLLDDVDTKHGRVLFRALADASRDDYPLTVVATSSGGVAGHVAPDGKIPLAEKASYDDYVEHRQREYERDSYPVALRDLTLDEVKDMVSDVAGAQLIAHRTVATEVYRFTRGHPAATHVLVKAIGDNTGDITSLKRQLEARWRGPVDEDPVTVEKRLRKVLLGELPDTALATLAACSAARDIEQADELRNSGLVVLPLDDAELVPAELQVHDPDTGREVMLPALRHLLLRHLAATPDQWTAVHTWLRDNGREADRFYHALALRDVAEVVRRLAELLGDPKTWFAELESVTAAPNDLDADESDPTQVLAAASQPVPADEPARTIARVVAALWAANDPVSTVDRAELYRSAATDLNTLAQHPGVARHDFRKEARKLKDKAEHGDISVPGRAAGWQALTQQDQIDFTPPTTRRGRRRARVRLAAIAMAVVLAAGAVAAVGWNLLNRCDGGVYEVNGECVGVTDGSYVFDDRLAAVEERILAENERVDADSHVTLALLTPMIPSATGSSTWERIRAQLEGAHVAQLRANDEANWPKVKLVLAHPGSDQQEWRGVVERLVEMADGSEHLVGVIGLVPSSRMTQEVMGRLAAANLPMVGTLVTATGINDVEGQDGKPGHVEGFTRVSSTTHDQITVLSDYLGTATPRKAMLVYDREDENLFVSAMRDDFKSIAPTRANLSITVESQYDTEASLNAQLKTIMGDLCGDGAPDTILYAARAELFDELVVNVRERNCARDRTVTVISGSDASVLRAREDLRPNDRDENAKTVILYTPLVDPDALRQDGVKEFEQLAGQFEQMGFGTADLADGWAVITHDAMLAAADAISRAAAGRGGELPSRTDVRFEVGRTDRERNQVRGAGGTFTLDAETGNAVGRRLPVIEVDENWSFTVKGIYDAGPQR
jgi:hypothetical protein